MTRSDRRRHPSVLLMVLWGLLGAGPCDAAAQNDRDDVERLEKALGIRPGATVAEIGAGSGSLTVLVAGRVGEAGRVYSNEIDAGHRATIREAVEAASLKNVTIVESGTRDANLPAGCCDAIFMRNVYHHFPEPGPMAASLYQALKPGGRLAVIDFAPGNGREAERAPERDVDGTHGVFATTVTRELRQAGFEVLRTEEGGRDRWYMVVAMRPEDAARRGELLSWVPRAAAEPGVTSSEVTSGRADHGRSRRSSTAPWSRLLQVGELRGREFITFDVGGEAALPVDHGHTGRVIHPAVVANACTPNRSTCRTAGSGSAAWTSWSEARAAAVARSCRRARRPRARSEPAGDPRAHAPRWHRIAGCHRVPLAFPGCRAATDLG